MKNIPVTVDYQLAINHERDLPSKSRIQAIVDAVLMKLGSSQADLAVRVVDESEMIELNRRYRQRNSSTNVLSFPFARLEGIEEDYLGDVVICYLTAKAESSDRDIDFAVHFAHLLVHGVLHLFGYDHRHREEAEEMEGLEREILSGL